jgi:hypothetical protein
MKQKMYTRALVVGCLLSATSLSAQTTLSRDFSLGADSIILPESLRAAAGYPAWRMVTMQGQDAVPYNYCSWLLVENPWSLQLFGTTNSRALKKCADGITAVTRQNTDASVPSPGSDAQFWRNRPVGYQYMVPDHTIDKATYDSLMQAADTTAIPFVSNPVAFSAYLDSLQERVTALEEWQQQLADDGGVMSQSQLREWLDEQGYLSVDTGTQLLTHEQAAEQFVSKDALPDGDILTRQQADEQYVSTELFDEFRRSFIVTDPADKPAQTDETTVLDDMLKDEFSWWKLLWLIPLVILVLFLWRVLRSNRPASSKEDKGSSGGLTYVTQEKFSDLQKEVETHKEKLGEVEKKTDDALRRVDDVREGLAALIEIEAHDQLKAPGFTNTALKQLGDEPFVLTMPGVGVARKQVHVYNRGDYIELFGLEKGYDRVDKLDTIAVLKHLAKARRPENNWITGITAQKAA